MGDMDEMQVGPWGGSGSKAYSWKSNSGISKIYVNYGDVINGIAFARICSCDGKEHWSPVYGGNSGCKKAIIELAPGELIVEMKGTFGSYAGETLITSLSFKTNKKTSCTCGTVTENHFSLPVNTDNTKFVGFHGQYGTYVNTIGVFIEPK